MSGEGKRGDATWPKQPRPSSTLPANSSSHAATYTFLAINGARLTASASETEALILGLHAAGTFNLEHLSRWLRLSVDFEKARP
jgi:death-on-curing protein